MHLGWYIQDALGWGALAAYSHVGFIEGSALRPCMGSEISWDILLPGPGVDATYLEILHK